LLCARYIRQVHPFGNAVRAYRVCHLVFAAPPLFVLLGVLCLLIGISGLDYVIWLLIWATIACYCGLVRRRHTPSAQQTRTSTIRAIHGFLALAVMLVFLAGHLFNHLLALWSPDLHEQVRLALRHVYGGVIVEPLLVVSVIALGITGIGLALRHTRIFGDE